ncbi:homoserine dehydrogenase-like [Panicum virgatum]|uniref:homoserine dehydrogenase-like n=1 Tax=Panicum virgatum TaxID=38727 RepID=UPI0019D62F9E|nr:homoserine dehydrogenase-like [Panicum virgatum]
MPTPVKSVLLGCGGVGRYLLRHIGVAIRVVGVADDVHSSGLDDALLTHLCTAKTAGSPLSSLLGLGLVLVDCSATYDTVSLLKDAVDHGCCIVLANKKPLTGAYEDFQKLVSNFRRIRFESTNFSVMGLSQNLACNAFDVMVGAGLPVIASVTRIIASGDPVSRIVGSLSGTLGYVMSELEEGKRFSEVVKTAKSLGYTEPGLADIL